MRTIVVDNLYNEDAYNDKDVNQDINSLNFYQVAYDNILNYHLYAIETILQRIITTLRGDDDKW